MSACSGKAKPCARCRAPRCERHRYSYVDGNNGSITRNAREYCEPCYRIEHGDA